MGLTKSQEEGLFAIKFAQKHSVIIGPAGTGKTYLLRHVLEWLEKEKGSEGIVFCAPTHQAKKVLQSTINEGRSDFDKIKAYTIHSILKIHPETYEDEVVFENKGEIPEEEDITHIVVDEISMVDAVITDRLLKFAKQNNVIIIGLGDPYQIQPVNSEGSYRHPTLGPISMMFKTMPDFTRVVLEGSVRQAEGNPIIVVATDIRKNNSDIYELVSEDGKYGIFRLNSTEELINKYLEYVKTPEDTLDYKIMAFTNASVNGINDIIRQKLFNNDNPYVVGEYLVMQDPVYDRSGKYSRKVYDNGEICKVIDITDGTQVQRELELPNLVYDAYVPSEDPNEMDEFVKGLKVDPINVTLWELKTVSVDSKVEYTFYSIKDGKSLEKYNEYISLAAEIYKSTGKEYDDKIKFLRKELKIDPVNSYKYNAEISELRNKKREMWAAFWALKSKFVDVKGSAACTFHKSQGSTYTGAFIIRDGLEKCEYHLARQLRYVGVTRAKEFVYFV